MMDVPRSKPPVQLSYTSSLSTHIQVQNKTNHTTKPAIMIFLFSFPCVNSAARNTDHIANPTSFHPQLALRADPTNSTAEPKIAGQKVGLARVRVNDVVELFTESWRGYRSGGYLNEVKKQNAASASRALLNTHNRNTEHRTQSMARQKCNII
jgi:hypothetical protein